MNLEYCLVQAFFWAGCTGSCTFAAFFLQEQGYSNSSIGLILAFGNLIGFLLPPYLASLIDSSSRISLFHCLWGLLGAELVFALSFNFLPGGLFMSLFYSLYIGFTVTVNPLNTHLSLQLEQQYGHINYGVARGVGSLVYSITSVLLGTLTASMGAAVVPVAAFVLVAAQALILLIIHFQYSRTASTLPAAEAAVKTESRSMPEFFRENRRFCIMLLGVAMLFFAHNLPVNFLINIVRNVGGDTKELGNLNAFFSLVEIPALFAYDRIVRRFKCSSTVRFAAVFFFLKALGTALAGSMFSLYAVHSLQLFAFGVITPALVHYVNIYISPADAAKGQSLAYCVTSLGSIFATSLGGMMFDHLSIRTTLLISAAVSLCGMVTILFAAEKD